MAQSHTKEIVIMGINDNRYQEAKAFWARIDELNPFGSVTRLCEETGIDINRVKQQRSEGYVPKWKDQLALAKALNCSLEYLLTGEKEQEADSFSLNGKSFWERIDKISPFKTVFDFSKAVDMSYDTVKQQRHDKTIPRRPRDLLNIALALDTSIEFLLTGQDVIRNKKPLSRRTERIAWHCENTASDDDLFIIEKILGIRSDYEVVPKAEQGRKSTDGKSSSALA